MKIEKINDNQIRCTLTRADLADRQLKLSELAYGTEKAKSLFHDMMQQAAFEFGFEAENIPLMIEAIPTSSDSIVLIITKVEDPEELDTRFSKFAPSPANPVENRKPGALEKLEGAEDFLNLLNKVKEAVSKLPEPKENDAAFEAEDNAFNVRLLSFSSLDSVIRAAGLLKGMYSGSNTLYKEEKSAAYILALSKSEHTTSDFNKICNMLSEYGCPEKATPSTCAYLEEHCEVIISGEAVQKLAQMA